LLRLRSAVVQYCSLLSELCIFVPEEEIASLLCLVLAGVEPTAFVDSLFLHLEVFGWEARLAFAVPYPVGKDAFWFCRPRSTSASTAIATTARAIAAVVSASGMLTSTAAVHGEFSYTVMFYWKPVHCKIEEFEPSSESKSARWCKFWIARWMVVMGNMADVCPGGWHLRHTTRRKLCA
jgi:hypothetical protein